MSFKEAFRRVLPAICLISALATPNYVTAELTEKGSTKTDAFVEKIDVTFPKCIEEKCSKQERILFDDLDKSLQNEIKEIKGDLKITKENEVQYDKDKYVF